MNTFLFRTFSEVAHSQGMCSILLTTISFLVYGYTERHSRTTIYTTVTTITKKKFTEEQLVNDQWVTTDEYQVSSISTIC